MFQLAILPDSVQVERDERSRRVLGEHLHPTGGRMNALLQRDLDSIGKTGMTGNSIAHSRGDEFRWTPEV